MGYATTFNLKWSPVNKNSTIPQYELDDLISSAIRTAQDKDSDFMYAIDPEGESVDSCKWYQHEEEVREFSKQFPDVLFTLSGAGEESGDIWKQYFVNGKSQYTKAKLVFEDFDLAKLS